MHVHDTSHPHEKLVLILVLFFPFPWFFVPLCLSLYVALHLCSACVANKLHRVALLHFMILHVAVRYCAGCVLDHILVHLAIAYISVYRCMCRPICVCIPFNFSCTVVCNLQHHLLQF